MANSSEQGRDWLPDFERAWAHEHQDVLNEIYGAFTASGEWPDPVQLQRQLRARGSDLDLLAAVQDMPRLLGWRETSPAQVKLSLFGIGCCPAARWLLARLVDAVDLALSRFDDADSPNRLTRAEVDEQLQLDKVAADRLSALILHDSFMLGGGDAGQEAWDQTIHENVLRLGGSGTPDELLRRLAKLRAVGPAPKHMDAATSPPRALGSGDGKVSAWLHRGADTWFFLPTPPGWGLGVVAGNSLGVLGVPLPGVFFFWCPGVWGGWCGGVFFFGRRAPGFDRSLDIGFGGREGRTKKASLELEVPLP